MAKVRKFSNKTFTCAKCGNEFTALRKHELCPVCNEEKRKAYQKSYVRKENRGKLVIKKVEKVERKKTLNTVQKQPREPSRCLFCGKMTTDGDFCKTCRKDGFDNVYLLTHHSNGWDNKKKERVAVVSGWRGQPCVGFFAGRNGPTY